jgi:hypothetical protein
MTRSTWLTILLVVIGAFVAFAVYTRMHPAPCQTSTGSSAHLEPDAGQPMWRDPRLDDFFGVPRRMARERCRVTDRPQAQGATFGVGARSLE